MIRMSVAADGIEGHHHVWLDLTDDANDAFGNLLHRMRDLSIGMGVVGLPGMPESR